MENIVTIKIAPTADMVNMLANDEDILAHFANWMGRPVPASAVPRLDRLQALATTMILDAFPGATVFWSSEYAHLMGAVKSIQVYINDDVDDGFTQNIIEDRVHDILDRAFHYVLKAIVDGVFED